ncbi:MAG: endonuclease/exonuclease/phosphatase family protein [Prevotella sp.]|nr:endonuclease/exonuclease/phosphatase family protein [Prevotella sp.]
MRWHGACLLCLSFFVCFLFVLPVEGQVLVELNCENLFDCQHDEGKDDAEFMPDGSRRWTRTRYWRKMNAIGQEILSCSDELPDLVALIEIENDTVLRDLTRRSLLRNAGYQYLMTNSPDVRGLDVALLYQPVCFRPICYDYLEVPPMKNMRPTRDILYVEGENVRGDTLHLFVVHAPSRYNGELETRPFRQQAMNVILAALDSLVGKNIIVVGDFNDYADSPSLLSLSAKGMDIVSRKAKGFNGHAKGTYRYQGEWRSIDHVLVSPALLPRVDSVYINDTPFLLEAETTYGGWKPRRTFQGFRYQRGFSDHLPLVVRFR